MNFAEYTWHALYCQPQKELAIEHDLWTREKLPTIVPAEKDWQDKNGRTRITYRAVMPRYVFTGFRRQPDWEAFRKDFPQIQGYMQFGEGGPTKLSLADVRWLFDYREALRGRLRPTVVEGVIRVGEKVKVIHGPFSGQSVMVDKVVAQRIHTIQDFLGAPRLFKIPLADLAPIW
jgi:transcription antitermination factor NusG